MVKCPICSSEGWDLVFDFYCSSQDCQNYNKKAEVDNKKEFKTEYRKCSTSKEIIDVYRKYFPNKLSKFYCGAKI